MATQSAVELASGRGPKGRGVFGDAKAQLRAIVRYRELVRYLVATSIRAENAGTIFGFLWWLLDPLFLMGVFVVFVDVILRRGGPDYPIFILTAILSWEFFAKTTRNSMNVTLYRDRLMRQVAFPRGILPLSTTIADGFHLMFGFVVLVLIAIPFGINPHPIDLLALPVLLVQAALTLGVALFVSALNIFFRDTNNLMGNLLRLWWFLSPGLYTVAQVPEAYRQLYKLNPFATLFPAYRAIFMRHSVPDLRPMAILTVASLLVLVLGFLFFARRAPSFAKVN
jgi:ABC-type polysaccharide/polyol phosphate export permease